MDSLYIALKERMRVEADSIVSKRNKDSVLEQLLQENDFEVPQASVESEAQLLLKDMESQLQQQGNHSNTKLPKLCV
jgi:FKBP-type peptidyl-prolyl cis-trans isomerase (trigger factor)